MLEKLLPLIPTHRVYAEPVTGCTSLFWRKGKLDVKWYTESINDPNQDLVNLYQQMRIKSPELERIINPTPCSMEEYHHCCDTYQDLSLSEAERARRFYVAISYLINSSLDQEFKYESSESPNPTCISANLCGQHVYKHFTERMQGVYIEFLPMLRFLEVWDTPETFFYIDSPYLNPRQNNYTGYTQNDFIDLCGKLKQIKGKFMLRGYADDASCDSWHKMTFNVTSTSNPPWSESTEYVWLNYTL